ncbi:MAG: DUF1015 domain-containing protein, partial [Omnitrophica WOR_2 bacterium]
GKPETEARIQRAQANMRAYLQDGILEPFEGMVYVERFIEGRTRRGVLLCLDLEKYDYHPGSKGLIRATEGTILERIPPRMKIREGAVLELPHIMVLIDDPGCTVIDPISMEKDRLRKLYDFDLIMDSGHLEGFLVNNPSLEDTVIAALQTLADPRRFTAKYHLSQGETPMLFAVGDGNHSLASAKAVWENLKPVVSEDHPARYALVEVENIHDDGLQFEPIHRVLFGLKMDVMEALRRYSGGSFSYSACRDCTEMMDLIENHREQYPAFGIAQKDEFGIISIQNPKSNLPVGELQPFLDSFLQDGGAERIDYIHGDSTFCRLSSLSDSCGFFLPKIDKSDLFKTVILDGALPRKTFSMGEAHEKRFYMECRIISSAVK